MQKDTFISRLQSTLGEENVLTKAVDMQRFCQGFRSGNDLAIAVLMPKNLLDYWNALKLCVEADVIIIMQAANTGLTEGSTPNGGYDRDCVIISTLAMNTIVPINNGHQIIAHPGRYPFCFGKYAQTP